MSGMKEEEPHIRTSVLPNEPTAFRRSRGTEPRCARPGGGGGLPMIVSFSLEGSSSDRASRSQEDCANAMSGMCEISCNDALSR